MFLGLGSNLGNRQDNITHAITELKEHKIDVERIATTIETDPVGGPPQGKFLNTVVKIQTALTAEQLLDLTQSIEKKLGRVRTQVNGPRTIDIDILLYNNQEVSTPRLTIPHPRMKEREFILKPLKEIAPELFTSHPWFDSRSPSRARVEGLSAIRHQKKRKAES